MAQELSGQVAIVTGGTGGLGHAVTRALLEDGAHTVVTYRAAEERARLEERVAPLHDHVTLVELDVTDPAAVERLVAQVLDQHSRIDILAHLVGGYLGGKEVQETSLDEWQRLFQLNLTSAFVCCRAVLPAMRARDYGRIIAVSSRAAVRISPGASAYAASKVALLALIESIAEENHTRHITANAILPSIIDTAANRAAMPRASFELWPKPEEIAEVIRFLASDRSRIISGAAIPVYGRA